MPSSLLEPPSAATVTTILDLPPEIRNIIYFFVESLVAPPFDSNISSKELDGGNKVCEGGILRWYWPLEARIDIQPIQFLRQPAITKVCHQIRDETLPIFYSVNRFLILDQYYYAHDGVKTPFLNILWDWLNRIRPHISLMRHLDIECHPAYCAQRAHEIITALTDHGFEFKAGGLSECATVKEDE
jgi:hypothetical protein